MLFSSNVFLFLFLPVSLLGYQMVSSFGSRSMLGWLTLVSLFFYGFWNPIYLILLIASIAFNYVAAKLIDSSKEYHSRQKMWLTAAICGNLALLMYFKYLFPILNFLHMHWILPRPFTNVVLPLGISFFTFTQIAFLIDLAQGIAERQGILSFSLFVTFFPHLIAGPIIHPREMMPQFASDRLAGGLRSADLTIGLTWFIMGLAKKVLIADRISPVSDAVFGHPQAFQIGGIWIGVLTYTMQLYFDFSGYSDMAVGLARMFSIEFPVNFNSPYKSVSVVDFWTRWHMTLSRYLNEYLYNPISHAVRVRRTRAGKKSTRKTFATPEGFLQLVAFPTLTTMVIAGIWHGAGLQFLMYGVVFGVYIVIYHLWRTLIAKDSFLNLLLPKPVSIAITYLSVVVALTFFRASSLSEAFYLIASMLGKHSTGLRYSGNPFLSNVPYFNRADHAIAALVACFTIVWFLPNTQEILDQQPRDEMGGQSEGISHRLLWHPSLGWGLCLSLVLILSILMLGSGGTFLYFQF